jgi:hypothetical protein
VASVLGAPLHTANRHQGGRLDRSGGIRVGVPLDLHSGRRLAYATVIVPQMVLTGLGMGLISTPATESIQLVLPPARAVSARPSTTRLASSVAPSGSPSWGRSSRPCTRHGSPTASSTRSRRWSWPGAQESVGTAQRVSAGSPRLTAALQDAFLAGLSTKCVVIGVLCLTGGAAAYLTLPGRPAAVDLPTPAPSMT